jgi:hypothetical protein
MITGHFTFDSVRMIPEKGNEAADWDRIQFVTDSQVFLTEL